MRRQHRSGVFARRLPRAAALLLASLACLLLQEASAATVFNISSQMHTVAREADGKVPPDADGEETLISADHVLALINGSNEVVYDFAKRRRFVINLKTKTYINESLYSTAGFRVLEFQSREAQRKAVKAPAAAAILPSTLDSEHALAIGMGGTAEITGSKADGRVIFSEGTRELAHWSDKGVDASPGDVAAFVQFLRYTTGGHPQILAELQRRHSVPSDIVLSFNQPYGTTSRHLSVSAGKPVDWNADYLADLRPESEGVNSIDTLLDQGARLNQDDALAAQLKNREVTGRALQDKRFFDVLLGTVEFRMITGTTTGTMPPEVTEAIKRDDASSRFQVAISAKTKPELDQAIKTLVELRSSSTSGLNVLKIFEANARVHVGDASALALFGEALQAEPALSSGYKDLGDLFILKYDTPRAWRSWDIGRQLAPKLPQFVPVNDFEVRLVKEHPEYF